MQVSQRPTVLLCTEGTYPYAGGGVSRWCDVLCTELADIDFVLYALTGVPEASARFALPTNVRGIVHLPLWGTQEPGEYAFPGATFRELLSRRRRTSRLAIEQSFLPILGQLLAAIREGRGDVEVGRVLHGMWRYFQRHDWNRTWRSASVWEAFIAQASRPVEQDPAPLAHERPHLHDLTAALRWLAHFLLPLAVPIPRADLVHTTVAGFAALAGIVAKHEHGTPFVVTEHGVFVRERYMSLADGEFSPFATRFLVDLASLMARLSYAHADVVAPVAGFNRRWELPYGADPRHIEVIYSGIDTTLFRPRPKPAGARPTVVAAARVFPLKDIETMIRAAAVARAAVPDVQFIVYGSLEVDPPYVERCRALIGELGLEESFRLAGPHASPPDLYIEGDISVLSSISEGVPYAVLESLSCGRPVVATDVGGVAEVLGGLGIVVPPRNPMALGEAVAALLTDGELRRELAHRGRELVEARFRTEYTIAAYRDVYCRLAPVAAEPGDARVAATPLAMP